MNYQRPASTVRRIGATPIGRASVVVIPPTHRHTGAKWAIMIAAVAAAAASIVSAPHEAHNPPPPPVSEQLGQQPQP